VLGKHYRLNYTVLWILAALTGLGENWLLHKFGLDTAQRTMVALGLLPLLVFLVVTCVFLEMGRPRD
jgi:hypothetical protein